MLVVEHDTIGNDNLCRFRPSCFVAGCRFDNRYLAISTLSDPTNFVVTQHLPVGLVHQFIPFHRRHCPAAKVLEYALGAKHEDRVPATFYPRMPGNSTLRPLEKV